MELARSSLKMCDSMSLKRPDSNERLRTGPDAKKPGWSGPGSSNMGALHYKVDTFSICV